MRRVLILGSAVVLALLALPAVALASARPSPTLVFPTQQVWPLVIGALVPLATYVINKVGPWVSQPVKAGVLVAVSAVATALYTALATNVIGFNSPTLQLVLTGIAASLGAHHWLWKPSGISTLLGAYHDFGVHPSVGKIGAPIPAAVTVPAPGAGTLAPVSGPVPGAPAVPPEA